MPPRKNKVVTSDFSTKEFNIYFPFETKDAACTDCGTLPCTCEDPAGRIITIKGFANFVNNINDDSEVFVDHTNDVVCPDGFQLDVWNSNPQILWQHDRGYTIGKGISAVTSSKGLEVTAEIHEAAMSPEDFYKIDAGLVKMYSIGFKTLAGEFRTIQDKEVFFITKCILMEVSAVGIPANSMSSFSKIKSLGDGSFYAEPSITKNKSTPIGDDTVKVTLRNMLSEDKVKELEDLGLGVTLDELKDVDTKSYIESLVNKCFEQFETKLKELETLITKSAETPEVKSEEDKPAAEDTETKEDTPSSEDEVKTDVEAPVEEEVTAETKEAFKSLSDAITNLKTLAFAE